MLANVPRPGKGFAGLARYLFEGHAGRSSKKGRVNWTTALNLMTDEPRMAMKIMTATARLSKRCERPVYHLIVSWHADEQPSRAQMESVAGTTLAQLGLERHQVLIVAHGDTRNPHMHLIVNRVHPETGVAWSTSQDYRRIERSMRMQAEAMGFRFVPGRHNRPELQAAPEPGKPRRKRTPSKGAVHLARKRRMGARPDARPEAEPQAEP